MSGHVIRPDEMPSEFEPDPMLVLAGLAAEDPAVKGARLIALIRWWLAERPLEALPIELDGEQILLISGQAVETALEQTAGPRP